MSLCFAHRFLTSRTVWNTWDFLEQTLLSAQYSWNQSILLYSIPRKKIVSWVVFLGTTLSVVWIFLEYVPFWPCKSVHWCGYDPLPGYYHQITRFSIQTNLWETHCSHVFLCSKRYTSQTFHHAWECSLKESPNPLLYSLAPLLLDVFPSLSSSLSVYLMLSAQATQRRRGEHRLAAQQQSTPQDLRGLPRCDDQ